MILNNMLEDTLEHEIQGIISFDQLDKTVLSAAHVLCFLQNAFKDVAAINVTPILPFAKYIPALSGNILELHFGMNKVDFATRLNKDFDKPLIEELKHTQHQLPFVNNDFITLIRQEEKNSFPCGIENIWLEYDAPFHAAPALFFDINKSDVFCPEVVCSNLQQVANVFGCSVNDRLLYFLQNVQQAGFYTVYYGLMFSRSTKSIRLTINGIQAEQLTHTLISLGWKGNQLALEKLATTYLTSKQKLVVGVDFGNGVEDRIGIEVFDDNNPAFIQLLYNHQQIDTSHVALLNTWQQRFKLPEQLSKVLTHLHQRPIDWLCTRINHFKFVIDNTNNIAVKGYLYYCF